jgi:Tetratrico peptide repeat
VVREAKPEGQEDDVDRPMGRSWESRVADVWSDADSESAESVVAALDELARERPAHDPIALYERASARDFAGAEADAERLYRAALARGLERTDSKRGVEARVQLASTLRLLGRAAEGLDELPDSVGLTAEQRDWVAAFRALALLDAGCAEEAARTALGALSGHLTQYGSVVAGYAAGTGSS